MTSDEIAAKLRAPFDPADVKWKPVTVKGNRAMVAAYLKSGAIQERLESVFGYDGWQDDYQQLPDGSVMCFLSVRVCCDPEKWIKRCDVGSPSEQPDGGDRTKAAFTDALKRAAVKYGIGRYIHKLGMPWVDYDPATKKLTLPQLPAWALPPGKQQAPAKAAPAATSPPPAPTQAANPQAAPAKEATEAEKDAETDDLLTKLDACQTKQALDLVLVLLKSRAADLGKVRADRLRARYAQVDSKFTPPKATNVAQAAKEVLGAVPVSEGGPPFGVQ